MSKPTPLDAAHISANVSYKDGPTREEIEEILTTGIVPERFVVHVNHLLTEMPARMLEAAVLQVCGDPALVEGRLEKLRAQVKVWNTPAQPRP